MGDMNAMDYETAVELFEQRDGRLYWKKSINSRSKIGLPAGRLKADGYRKVHCYGESYPEHRLVWLINHGAMPDGVIDHIDHNGSNNRIENLRVVTSAENSKNASRSAANKSGVTGVNWEASKQRWRAQISIGGIKTNLGRFVLKRDAIKARKDAELAAGYHRNHGAPV